MGGAQLQGLVTLPSPRSVRALAQPGGKSCNFLSFYLAFISLCTATHAYSCSVVYSSYVSQLFSAGGCSTAQVYTVVCTLLAQKAVWRSALVCQLRAICAIILLTQPEVQLGANTISLNYLTFSAQINQQPYLPIILITDPISGGRQECLITLIYEICIVVTGQLHCANNYILVSPYSLHQLQFELYTYTSCHIN